MKKIIILLFIFVVTSGASDLTTYRDTYERELGNIALAHGERTLKLHSSYLRALDSLQTKVQKAGVLDKIVAIKSEKERFNAEKSVPDTQPEGQILEITSIQKSFLENDKAIKMGKARSIMSLVTKYDRALEALQQKLAKEGAIENALAVQEERKRVDVHEEIVAAKKSLKAGSEDEDNDPWLKNEPKNENENPNRKQVSLRDLEDGLLLHYAFDADRGNKVIDSSGKRNHGMIGGTPLNVKGIKGSALSFDGVKDLIVVQSSRRSGGVSDVYKSDYTLALWFKPLSQPQSGEGIGFSCILVKAGWPVGLIYGCDGSLGMGVWLSSDINKTPADPEGKISFSVKASPLNNGEGWVHLVATVDSDDKKIKVYSDGVLDAEDVWPYKWNVANNSEPWRIGMSKPGSGKYTAPSHGCVDDVRIYDRVLSGDEVEKLYELTK